MSQHDCQQINSEMSNVFDLRLPGSNPVYPIICNSADAYTDVQKNVVKGCVDSSHAIFDNVYLDSRVQGSRIRLVRGLVNFVPALA